jgi:hypothetical protein
MGQHLPQEPNGKELPSQNHQQNPQHQQWAKPNSPLDKPQDSKIKVDEESDHGEKQAQNAEKVHRALEVFGEKKDG